MIEADYCEVQVRLYDHDRYLTAIFAPAVARRHIFALYAFNLEIAKVREVVSEPLIGRMRLQWWRDALDRLYAGETVAHEVARPLGEAIRVRALERTLFDRLIDAREQDLDNEGFADMAAVEAYCEETTAPLLQLAQQALAPTPIGEDESLRSASRHVGIAWALTGLARAVPFHARQRRLYLPIDLLEAAGIKPARLFDRKIDPALADAIRVLDEAAARHLDASRRALRAVPPAARSPLLLADLAEIYLTDMRKAGWNPFASGFPRAHPLAVIRLALRVLFG